jgi:hypothetical protein
MGDVESAGHSLRPALPTRRICHHLGILQLERTLRRLQPDRERHQVRLEGWGLVPPSTVHPPFDDAAP